MADYIFIRKSRNAISSLAHVILNLLLAVVSIGATVVTGSYIIGLVLIVVSKWRVFAVNHRYWLLNLRSSLVDFIVGVSFVLLAYAAGTTFLPVHFVLMISYAVWLIFIKPRSSNRFAVAQALIAVLLGTTTATIFAAIYDSVLLVAAEFIIGFAASNHVLVQGNEENPTYISLVTGLIFSEIAWLSHTWLIIYTFGSSGLCLSQLAVILTVLMYAYFQLYNEAAAHDGKIKFGNVAVPVIFSLVVVAVLIISFSQPRFNI